jgi:uncharacterized protein (TIGR02118 family)
MTYKLYALWSAPTDAEGFEAHYAQVHMPAVQKVPGLTGLVGSLADSSMGEQPYYRVAELSFADKAGFLAATQTPEWAAMQADSAHIVKTFGASLSAALAESTEFD